jgi:protein TonB
MMPMESDRTGAEEAPFAKLLASRPPRSRSGTAAATLVSVAWHAGLLGGLLSATRAIALDELPVEEVHRIVDLAERIQLPPPPRPAEAPRVETEEVPFGHQVLAVPEFIPAEIPPPDLTNRIDPRDFLGEGRSGGRGGGPRESGNGVVGTISPDEVPRFTTFEVRPRILNLDEVRRMLERTYPPLLRDAGVGGEVTVWFFIDREGRVLKRLVDRPSGYDTLDAAALKVADIMRFSPAQNRGVAVPVWVSLPIRFATR